MTQKLLPLDWRDNTLGEVLKEIDKLSFEAIANTLVGQYRISYFKNWKLRCNGGLLEVCETLEEAKEKAYLDYVDKIGELYANTTKVDIPIGEQIAMEKTNNPMTEMEMAFFQAVAAGHYGFDFRGQRYSCPTYAQDRLRGIKGDH